MTPEKMAIIVGFFILVGWVIYLLFRRYELQKKASIQRIEYQNRLLDRFGSAQEIAQFLKPDQGVRLLENSIPEVRQNPLTRVLWAVQISVVMLMIGVGFLVNAWVIGAPTDINDAYKVKEYIFWGVHFIAIGVGFFVVAGLTRMLAKKWDLIDSERKGP